jgi:hypothetical protein
MPRRLKIAVSVVGGGIGLAFTGLLAWGEIEMAASGCGAIDPTDPLNYSAVAISNDSSTPVVVDECRGSQCHPDEPAATLRPGERYPVHAACGVSGSEMTSWRITSSTGTPLGFIAVDTPRSTNGLVFPVSAAEPARNIAAIPSP